MRPFKVSFVINFTSETSTVSFKFDTICVKVSRQAFAEHVRQL